MLAGQFQRGEECLREGAKAKPADFAQGG